MNTHRHATHAPAKAWGRSILLWASWGCAAWFVVALALFKYASSLPPILHTAVVLSGTAVLYGALLATAYLFAGIWFPVRWRPGLCALVVNAVFFALFVSALP